MLIPSPVSSWFRCPDPKTFVTLILTLKSNGLRRLHKNQINTDPPNWNEVIFDNPHNNQIRFIWLWNQVKFETLHWNPVNLNRHDQTHLNFHAHTKTKDYRQAHKNKVNFHPNRKQVKFRSSH